MNYDFVLGRGGEGERRRRKKGRKKEERKGKGREGGRDGETGGESLSDGRKAATFRFDSSAPFSQRTPSIFLRDLTLSLLHYRAFYGSLVPSE